MARIFFLKGGIKEQKFTIENFKSLGKGYKKWRKSDDVLITFSSKIIQTLHTCCMFWNSRKDTTRFYPSLFSSNTIPLKMNHRPKRSIPKRQFVPVFLVQLCTFGTHLQETPGRSGICKPWAMSRFTEDLLCDRYPSRCWVAPVFLRAYFRVMSSDFLFYFCELMHVMKSF